MFILFLYVTKRNMMEYTIYIYIFIYKRHCDFPLCNRYFQATLWLMTRGIIRGFLSAWYDDSDIFRADPFIHACAENRTPATRGFAEDLFFSCLFGFLLGNLSGPCCSFKSSPRWGSIFGSGSGASFAWPKKGNGTPIGFGLQNFDQHLEHTQGKTHVHGRI